MYSIKFNIKEFVIATIATTCYQSLGFYNLEEVEKLKTIFDEDLLKIVMATCLKIGIHKLHFHKDICLFSEIVFSLRRKLFP